MRKIFTLAAAVLASMAMNAEVVTFTLSSIFDGNSTSAEVTEPVNATISTNGSKSNAKENKISNDGNYFQVILADATFSAASFNGYINSNDQTKNWAFQFSTDGGANWTAEEKQASDGVKEGHDISIAATVPDGANGLRIIRRSGTTAYVYAISLEIGGAAPSTDPVSQVTITGPAACYLGETVTYTMSTDVKATEYQWAVGSVQDGETKKTFSFKPQGIGTYDIFGQARNNYNEAGEWIISNVIDLVVTEKPAAVPCAELYPAASGDAPAEGGKVALTDASYGGNIIFAGAKSGNYTASFQYNEYGLQMCKGGADSVRVELGFNLKEGSIIKLHVMQNGLAGDKVRGFKLLAPGQTAVLTATWQQADETDLEKEFEYTVTATDKLAGQNTFGIVRSESAILHAVVVSDCGEEIVPATDPVTSVTVSGPAAGFVGQPVTFKATADADVDDWIWFVNDVAVDGAKAATFAFTPDAVGTYAIKAGARNGYNLEDGWINSDEVSIVISEALEQVSINESTVWDWTKAASVNEIKLTDSTTPKKNEEVLLANVTGMNNNADFNSQALLFSGEFPVRDGKYCQGQLVKFNTTVAGYVSVEYSNTGNRDEGQDLERILTVNGVKIGEGALRSDAIVKEINIPVEVGDVALSSVLKADETVQYIRIYKVEFSTEQIIPEGLEDIDASVKAVKIMHNGQLLIKKGDVFFNAQGAVVK